MAFAKRTPRPADAAQAYNGAVCEQLSDLQRARIIGATVDVVAQLGAGSVTVAHVVERSGVSRRTFYEQFSDREDCLLAAFERALTIAGEDVLPAYDAQKGWRERVRAGLVALLAFCDQEPSIARLLICESAASGARVNERRQDAIAKLTRIIDEGRTLTGTSNSGKAQNISPLAAEGTVGGVLAVIQARLTEEKRKSLLTLTGELMSMIVLPYLGTAAARRELERPTPARTVPERDGVHASLSPIAFKDLGMRLTYRTVLVLTAVAEHPSASNRVIGRHAGIEDQGQISKLLARLERIGLLQNTHAHPGKGAPNSWALTERGQQVLNTIKTHTQSKDTGGLHA